MFSTTWFYAKNLTIQEPRTCEVIFHRDDDIITAALEQGWESFCVENEFESGDTIRFKFYYGAFNHYVHVFKIDD